MIKDAQGHALTGATGEAAAMLDTATRALALAYGDIVGSFEAARKAAPRCAMAHLGKAWVFALANDAQMVPTARKLLDEARMLPLNEREAAHAAALAHAVEGHRASTIQVLDRHLIQYPRDLLAHFAALHADAFQGRFHCVRDRSARALPFWSEDMPSYGIMLSFYGFGLEEAGNFDKAEATARAAAALEPYGYWPHHAVSHVMEMTGRPHDGLKWMDEREAFWAAKDNANRVHIWWHKALFHVELGDYQAAMDIYDGPVLATQRPVGISLTNATALLWRLETLGFEGGKRWQDLEALWKSHADGRLCVFADVHAAMTALRADDGAEYDRLVAAMEATAAAGSEAAPAYRDIGLPIVYGAAAYQRGAYSEAVGHLLPARYDLWRIGGSHAQRDLIDWTLTEAAVRAGDRDLAMALAHERLGVRPDSHPNQRFLDRARALAG